MSFNLNYAVEGKGTPIVFQHGLGSNIEQPKKLLKGLEGIQLVSLDCPGHGESALFDNTPSFDYYTDEVIRLLDFLKIEKAIFGGISMGAGISMNIALRYPERVKGLILVRPAWLDQTSPENLQILLKAAELIPFSNGQKEFEQIPAFQSIKELLPNVATSILGVFSNSQRPEIPIVLKQMVNDVPFSNLKKIKTIQKPCIILANEDDPLHPFEMAEVIHQEIQNSELHKVTSRYIDDPKHNQEVKAIIKSFINT